MKRIIKFRGKDPKTDKWLYGSLVFDCDKKPMIFVSGYSHTGLGFSGASYVDPETVGQFTGMHDKNGKEIYEGDIFGIPHKDGIKQHFYRIVEYCCDGFYLIDNCNEGKYGDMLHREISLNGHYAGMAKTLRRFGCDYCVIGNIHDNPELLK